jgi:hypothetical protein
LPESQAKEIALPLRLRIKGLSLRAGQMG